MATFSRPLIALSLTEPDEGVLRYAGVAVRLCEAEDVQFVHVLPEAKGDAPVLTPEATHQLMRAEVRRLFASPLPPERHSFEVVRGPRLDQLLAVAVKSQRDLILLGHRRQRSGRRSLARRLAMTAPCSVWLVPEGSPPHVSNILVPTDFSSHSVDSLSVATALAKAGGLTKCRSVHVYFDPSTIRYDEHIDEVLGQEEAAFARFVDAVDRHGIEVEPVFEESTHPHEAILRVASEGGTDLLVMNTRGRSRAAAVLLGSVTSRTMMDTPIPLLAVKHFGRQMTFFQALVDPRMWADPSPKTS